MTSGFGSLPVQVKTGSIQHAEPSPSPAEARASVRLRPFAITRRRLQNTLALALGDAVALTLALTSADTIRWAMKGDHMLPFWGVTLVVVWWLGAAVFRLLPGWGLGAAEELRRQTILLTGVFGLVVVTFFLRKISSDASRIVFTMGYVIGLVLVPMTRLLVKRALIRASCWGVPVAIYGDRDTNAIIVSALREEPGMGYCPVAAFADDVPKGEEIVGLPVRGDTSEQTHAAPVAVVAMPGITRHRLIDMLDDTLAHYRTILIVPDLLEAPSLWVTPRDLRGILALEIRDNLNDLLARIVKRTADLLAVLLTAPLWIPLCTVLAAVIWAGDRRSPFFIQERIGLGGRVFRTFKFRTMHINAEAILRQRMEQDADLRDEWETHFKLKKDPRITPVGKLLRMASLDELPQIVNVLLGDMAIVGPRPLPLYHYLELPESVRKLREKIRPGITGLWQVSGRSEAGTPGMERWDTYYVRNWSIWLDIVILVRTFRAVVSRSGAY